MHRNIEVFCNLLHTLVRSAIQHGYDVLLCVLVPVRFRSDDTVANVRGRRHEFRVLLVARILRRLVDVGDLVES